METKSEIMQRLGKQDGKDEARWQTAIMLSGELDLHVNFCFRDLVELENKDFVYIDGQGDSAEMKKIFAELQKISGRSDELFLIDFSKAKGGSLDPKTGEFTPMPNE